MDELNKNISGSIFKNYKNFLKRHMLDIKDSVKVVSLDSIEGEAFVDKKDASGERTYNLSVFDILPDVSHVEKLFAVIQLKRVIQERKN